MSNIEWFLIIGICVAPFVALLFVLPKKLKKKQQKFETTAYVPEKKEEPVKEEKREESGFERPFTDLKPEIENYREFLQKRKDGIIKPHKLEVPNFKGEDYAAAYRRRNRNQPKPQNQDINSLSPEIKALLIAGILDRKF